MTSRYVEYQHAIETRRSALARGAPVGIVDPRVDSKWANAHVDSKAPNSYYDYFYAAEDIKVYVAELGNDPQFEDLPMHELGFNVTQEKAPVYGAFSYVYDAVMRGTRLVSGSFTLVTKYPNYMHNLLTAAANSRDNNIGNLEDEYPRPEVWRKDDENIRKYWSRHLDSAAIAQGNSEWSVHPPFSLVVVYGIQNTSALMNERGHTMDNRLTRYDGDQALMKDHNQRLVETRDANHADRIVLDAIELMSVSRIYSPNSPVIMEQYEFMARDMITPPRGYSHEQRPISTPDMRDSTGPI